MSLIHVLAFSGPHNLAALSGLIVAAAAKKTNSSFTLIFFILLFGVGYMFLIRPQRQRRQRQLQAGKQISVGDKVMLSSGILGRVEGFVGDHARIEVAPGTVIEVLRGAVSQRVEEATNGAGDAYTANSPFDGHGHDDLIDESDNDPYSVPPLESDKLPDSDEDGGGTSPGGNGSGGGNR
jgi:preprotein translocase subunit YajC